MKVNLQLFEVIQSLMRHRFYKARFNQFRKIVPNKLNGMNGWDILFAFFFFKGETRNCLEIYIYTHIYGCIIGFFPIL